MTSGNIGTYFLNSMLTVFPSLALILILSLAAGFGLEVMLWRGRNGIALLFLAGIMVPVQMVLLPLFTVYFHFGLIDSVVVDHHVYGVWVAIIRLLDGWSSTRMCRES